MSRGSVDGADVQTDVPVDGCPDANAETFDLTAADSENDMEEVYGTSWTAIERAASCPRLEPTAASTCSSDHRSDDDFQFQAAVPTCAQRAAPSEAQPAQPA